VSAGAAIQPDGLTGKRALVSGGTRGIGAPIAGRLKGGGVDIIVHVAGGGGSAPSGGFAKLTPELWRRLRGGKRA
jgi:NADP-dependent 3-hydroxy acid dehydrogenase YdfG